MATESAVTPDRAHPFTAGEDFCLVHNGSLSNPYGVRRMLEPQGIHFDTDNDTEAACRFLEWRLREGDDAAGRTAKGLRRTRRFLHVPDGHIDANSRLIRDPFACKPAVVAETDDYVAIASEFRSLAHSARYQACQSLRTCTRGDVCMESVIFRPGESDGPRGQPVSCTMHGETLEGQAGDGRLAERRAQPGGRRGCPGSSPDRRTRRLLRGRHEQTRDDRSFDGSAGTGVAENMMSGKVHVKGFASNGAGASAHGGLLVIDGDAGLRCGISLKGGDIVVGGSVGSFSAFMAQAGRMVICGDAGDALGDSLYEAVLYVRGSK